MNKKLLMITLIVLLTTIGAASAVEETASSLKVALLDYSPRPIQPGQTFDLFIEVSSNGNPTPNSMLEVVEEYPFILERTQDYDRALNLGSITNPQTLQFRVRVANDVNDGVVPLRIRYKTNVEQTGFSETTFDINIETFDAKLDLVEVEQIPEKIMPGEKGKLILTVANNDDRDFKNIDVVLDLTNSYDINSNMQNMIAVQAMINARLEEVNRRVASGLTPLRGVTPMMQDMGTSGITGTSLFEAFATVGTPNQKTIPLLNANTQQKVYFDIVALPDTLPNIYATPIYVNYNDEDNNPFHVRMDIPLVVDAEPNLYVDLKSTTLRTTDFGGVATFSIANRGKSPLQYVTVTLKENEEVQLLTAPRSLYLGTLNPGEQRLANFTVLAHEKNISLDIAVEYSDAYNEQIEEHRNIPYFIINQNYYRDLPYEMWLAWLILGVVVLMLTIFYLKKMSRKKS